MRLFSPSTARRIFVVGLLFALFTEFGDICSTMLNSRYSFWAGAVEGNPLVASPDGHAVLHYMLVVKLAWWLSFLLPISGALWLATRSKAVASLPFWWSGFHLIKTVAMNCLILARFHHFLHP